MFIWLIGMKIILYPLVFIRAFQQTPVNFSLVLIVLALLLCDFWRSFYKYSRSKVNSFTLLLNLTFAILFSFISRSGSFDKLFFIYLAEGTAILPKPFFIAYAMLTTAASVGSSVLFDFRGSALMQLPGIAELLLYVFVFVLVLSERRQREQRLAFEKLSKELRFVNFQLKESTTLSERLASEAERRRIVSEIHDSLGYNLTGLILSLEAGKKLVSHDVETGKTYLDKAIQISRVTLNSVRDLVSGKNDSYFEFELTPRLKEMVREVQALTGLQIDLDIRTQEIGLSGKEQFTMYRVFQEAITNTLRHSKADFAQISLSGNMELLAFSYWDNGSGTKQIEPGNGLKGMKDRISEIGGTISFQSPIGMGLKIAGCIDRRGNNNE